MLKISSAKSASVQVFFIACLFVGFMGFIFSYASRFLIQLFGLHLLYAKYLSIMCEKIMSEKYD